MIHRKSHTLDKAIETYSNSNFGLQDSFSPLKKPLLYLEGFKYEEGGLFRRPAYCCTYCGTRAEAAMHDFYYYVYVYKPPPDGAKDLRILVQEGYTRFSRCRVHCMKCGASSQSETSHVGLPIPMEAIDAIWQDEVGKD